MAVLSVSQSQLCELLGVDGRIVAIERTSTGFDITTTEGDMQTSGTFPELTRKTPRKGGKKR